MEERHLRGAALYMNYNRVFSLISVGFLWGKIHDLGIACRIPVE